MARFAPVAPIQVLEGLYAAGPEIFGDYHLLLAHHTVEHKARFRDLFSRVSDDVLAGRGLGKPCTVIMDNSIVELGDAVDDSMIEEAVNIITPNGAGCNVNVFPVLPDVMGKGHETREASLQAYLRWDRNGMPGAGYCAVCQGKTLGDFHTSLDYFGDKRRFPLIKMLSIPRVLHKDIGSRIRPAVEAGRYETSHKIHFLGFCDNVVDDVDSVSIIPTAGIDSAVPLRVREEFTQFTQAEKRPADWFKTAQVDTRMIKNLENAREMFTYSYGSTRG